jgi:hypothetical protein
LCMGVPSL